MTSLGRLSVALAVPATAAFGLATTRALQAAIALGLDLRHELLIDPYHATTTFCAASASRTSALACHIDLIWHDRQSPDFSGSPCADAPHLSPSAFQLPRHYRIILRCGGVHLGPDGSEALPLTEIFR